MGFGLVMLLIFMVELLLLLGTNRISGFPQNWKRVLPGAVVTALWGGACMMPGFSFLRSFPWQLLAGGVVCWISFGLDGGVWRRWGMFLLLSLTMGAIARNFSERKWLGLAVAALLVWLLCTVGSDGRMGGQFCVPMEIRYGDQILRLTALRDTGNTLRDPVTGEQVLVIDGDAASQLTGLGKEELSRPMETVGSKLGYRLILYRSIGQPRGMLLAKRFQDVRVGNWRGSAVVAFAPHTIGGEGGFRALVGGTLG